MYVIYFRLSQTLKKQYVLLPFPVPFYEDSSPQQRDNKEVFFEAPYGNIREEPAHSSK